MRKNAKHPLIDALISIVAVAISCSSTLDRAAALSLEDRVKEAVIEKDAKSYEDNIVLKSLIRDAHTPYTFDDWRPVAFDDEVCGSFYNPIARNDQFYYDGSVAHLKSAEPEVFGRKCAPLSTIAKLTGKSWSLTCVHSSTVNVRTCLFDSAFPPEDSGITFEIGLTKRNARETAWSLVTFGRKPNSGSVTISGETMEFSMLPLPHQDAAFGLCDDDAAQKLMTKFIEAKSMVIQIEGHRKELTTEEFGDLIPLATKFLLTLPGGDTHYE